MDPLAPAKLRLFKACLPERSELCKSSALLKISSHAKFSQELSWRCGWSMRVEHRASASHAAGLKVCFRVCDEESDPAVSWGPGGCPLEAVVQDFKDLLYVFHFFLSLLQWFDTAPSRTCPQCRNQVKPPPVHTCGTVTAMAPKSCGLGSCWKRAHGKKQRDFLSLGTPQRLRG